MGTAGLAVLLFAGRAVAQEPVYQLSTHMLDVSQGTPARGVAVTLYESAPDTDAGWRVAARRQTDRNGRIADLLPVGRPGANDGVYKLRFETEPYFTARNRTSIYPYVEVSSASRATGITIFRSPCRRTAIRPTGGIDRAGMPATGGEGFGPSRLFCAVLACGCQLPRDSL